VSKSSVKVLQGLESSSSSCLFSFCASLTGVVVRVWEKGG
jgi:hypothetical protein